MGRYCQLKSDSIISNFIICDDDESAKAFNAKPYYEGAKIGTKYAPELQPTELDKIEAQVAYTAIMTGTLLSEG